MLTNQSTARKMEEQGDMFNIITQMIKDFKWMRNEVQRLQKLLYGQSLPIQNWGVAQYGVEAAMPRGSKGKSMAEIKRIESLEEKRNNRLRRYETEVYLLETLGDTLQNETQKVIYDCLLEGMSYREIALHLMISKDNVQRQKKDIIQQLLENEQMETFLLYGDLD
ncbi:MULTISPECIES: sigma-70 family RNA polymerase sigma factor [Lysinibacillus]|uniref:sigma-70 family RNA polymerase sigma factor n=1 Tax=Lysinibacillus TaxID=400634 RepID=UPI003814109B